MRILRSVPQGTPEFMSTRLRKAWEHGEPHVPFPVDDLQSFWWTALWAAVYNPRCPSSDWKIQRWRAQLGSGRWWDVRDDVWSVCTPRQVEAALVKAILPLLREWIGSLCQLSVDFEDAFELLGDSESEEAGLRRRRLFYRFAYRGVKEFAILLGKHRESIQAMSG